MPRFTKLNAEEVHVGRGHAVFEQRKGYVVALKTSDAGRIDLESDDRPATVKRLRPSWEDSSEKALLWRKTARTQSPGAASARLSTGRRRQTRA